MKWRKAVFVVGYSKTNKGIEYIVLKRKLHWKGWEFPKGKIEPGEEKIKAAKRELFEETGRKAIKIKKFNYSGRYKYKKILPDRPNIIGQTYSLFAAEVEKGKVSLDPLEHAEFQWVTFPKAIKMLTWPVQRKALKIVNNYLIKNTNSFKD